MENVLIEGDNYYSLALLSYTHRGKVDVIYIDPPYNVGKNDFRYNDRWVDERDTYGHSKWLEFMNRRLKMAYKLLKPNGVIIIHIDEHEESNLTVLMNMLFGEKNFLGKIIWDKRNPKGDKKAISYRHETLIIFAKNAPMFLKNNKLERPKRNAEAIVKKANELLNKLSSTREDYPADIRKIMRKYNIDEDIFAEYKSKPTIEIIRNEFKKWINDTNFSEGEKAFNKISDDGRVYQTVSMAWPNKKQAPEQYFVPLVHPTTGKDCPIPQKGWRNNPATMEDLLSRGLIEFGSDETVQPRKINYLDEYMTENIPSIIEFAGSDEQLFKEMKLKFENPKPVKLATDILGWFCKKDSIVLDFFAGSGTVGHAIMEMNRDGGNRKFILCTNNENNICTDVCQPRLEYVMNKLEAKYRPSVRYFRINEETKPRSIDKRRIVKKISFILCIRESCYEAVERKNCQYHVYADKKGKHFGIIFAPDSSNDYVNAVNRLNLDRVATYVFSYGMEVPTILRSDGRIRPIPVPGALYQMWAGGFEA